MRILLFFDLPAVTKLDHRQYSKFVKFIKYKGFSMYQESVYSKLALNDSVVNATIAEIKEHLPIDGVVSVLTITEKQFSTLKCLLGDIDSDVIVNEEKIIKL